MKPIISYKRNSPFLQQYLGQKLKLSRNRSHNRVNSMIQINNQKNNKISYKIQKNNQKIKKQPLYSIQWFVSNQFRNLKEAIQDYCLKLNTEYLKKNHKQDQQNVRMSQSSILSSKTQRQIINEADILKQIGQMIINYLKERSKYESIQNTQNINIEFLNIKKKEIFLPANTINQNKRNTIFQNSQLNEKYQPIKSNKIICLQKNQKEINMFDQKLTQQKILNTIDIQLSYKSNKKLQRKQQNQFTQNNSCTKFGNIPEMLYREAKILQFQQFNQICKKTLLQNKPILSQIHIFKKQNMEMTNNYLNQIYKKLSLLNTQLAFVVTQNLSAIKLEKSLKEQNRHIGQQIDQICLILKKLNQIYNLNSLIFSCNRPCCSFQQNLPTNSTKAKILLNLKQSAKKSIHYKTDCSQEYFNRYYKKTSFNKNRIYSLSKTKAEQMEKLQKTYQKNLQRSKLYKKRCNSLFGMKNTQSNYPTC